MTCQRRAAKQTDERAFFIRKIECLQLDLECNSVFPDRFQHFKRGHHAQRAVETSPMGDRVKMRAEQKSGSIIRPTLKKCRMIACPICPKLETRALHFLPEPSARRKM